MRPRVLMVEDSAAMRQTISRILEPACDLVGWVEDGRRVLAMVLDTRPDVIVLDISVPGESGMTLLPKLRAAMPAAVIVMLTIYAGNGYVEEAYRRGADSYVLKNHAHKALLPAILRGRATANPEAAVLPAAEADSV